MMIRWIGAALILISSGGFGFMLARNFRREEAALQELISITDFLTSELACRLTPLPQLCYLASEQGRGVISTAFFKLAQELESNSHCDADSCMIKVVEAMDDLPEIVQRHLLELGKNFGKFDLQGQLAGIATVRQMCERDLKGLQSSKDKHLRSYQTLGLCAGAALVILLI